MTATTDVTFYEEGDTVAHEGALVSGTTYYAEIVTGTPSGFSRLGSVQWIWDSAIVVTSIEMESSNLWNDEAPIGGVAGADWSPESVDAVSVPGGSAATVMQHLADHGAARLRAKIVVGGTGGVLRGVVYRRD